MFGHGVMRFIFDPGNLTAIFAGAHRSPKDNNRASAGIGSRLGQIEGRLGE
jgi:hypothetical protein